MEQPSNICSLAMSKQLQMADLDPAISRKDLDMVLCQCEDEDELKSRGRFCTVMWPYCKSGQNEDLTWTQTWSDPVKFFHL